MGELAMLRFLIAHFQELYNHFSSSHPNPHPHPTTPFYLPPPPSSSSLSPHHPPSDSRWCFLDIDESSMEATQSNIITKSGKSGASKMKEPHSHKPPEAKRPRKERRSKASARPNSTELMDDELWKEFPEDLLEAVIARLPVSSFFRFRSVCRQWNSLLESQSFSQQCFEAPKTKPWFYAITHESVNTGAIYDSSMNKWRHPSNTSLLSKVILLPAAFAGGLVCFIDIGHKYFYVCNPITQTWKELPARSFKVWSHIAVGMTLNQDYVVGGYKILWVGRDGDYEVYDSLKNSWTCLGNVPSNIKLPLLLNFRSHAVSVGTTVFFLRSDPEGIVSYEMERGIWSQSVIPVPPNSSDPSLAECGSRVMLVGLLSKSAATCVCVWELQRMTLLWKEVDRMPNEWCLEFYGKHVKMTCFGNRGLLMLSLRSRQMNRIVTYDVATREWLKVPGCVLPRGRKRQWIACGTAFYPCLIASP